MKHKILYTSICVYMQIILFLTVSCNDFQKATQAILPESLIPENKSTDDHEGIYVGTFPFKNCPGIYTEVVLSGDRYKMKEVYQEKGNRNPYTFVEEGKYTWDDNLKVITLNGDASERFEVGDDTLYAIDLDGKRLTGDLANKYFLSKK